jgi:hypothetical protein
MWDEVHAGLGSFTSSHSAALLMHVLLASSQRKIVGSPTSWLSPPRTPRQLISGSGQGCGIRAGSKVILTARKGCAEDIKTICWTSEAVFAPLCGVGTPAFGRKREVKSRLGWAILAEEGPG